MLSRLIVLTSIYLSIITPAMAIDCLPSPIGTGGSALVKSTTKGDFAVWYCPKQAMPSMVVCLKRECGLVATKRAIASFASNPSLEGLKTTMAQYGNAYKDPALIAVWEPHTAEIIKLPKP